MSAPLDTLEKTNALRVSKMAEAYLARESDSRLIKIRLILKLERPHTIRKITTGALIVPRSQLGRSSGHEKSQNLPIGADGGDKLILWPGAFVRKLN